jgi:hypothetical protein
MSSKTDVQLVCRKGPEVVWNFEVMKGVVLLCRKDRAYGTFRRDTAGNHRSDHVSIAIGDYIHSHENPPPCKENVAVP